MKPASLDGRSVRARNLYHGVSGRMKPEEERLKRTYIALLFLLAMHSKAGGRSGVGWGCDELGKERALTTERIGMQNEHGLWCFSYEMQRQLWLQSGFSSASLRTSWSRWWWSYSELAAIPLSYLIPLIPSTSKVLPSS